MKKVFLLATAFLFVTGVAMADKGKKKKCAAQNLMLKLPVAQNHQKMQLLPKLAAKTKQSQLQPVCNC